MACRLFLTDSILPSESEVKYKKDYDQNQKLLSAKALYSGRI